MKCTWCGRGRMHRHRDPQKAAEGLTTCDTCNMTHSPHAIKGTFAYWDPTEKKIVMNCTGR